MGNSSSYPSSSSSSSSSSVEAAAQQQVSGEDSRSKTETDFDSDTKQQTPKHNLLENSPTASPSRDDEFDSSVGEEEDEEHEDDTEEEEQQPPNQQPGKAIAKEKSPSDDDEVDSSAREEEDEEHEDDTEEEQQPLNQRPGKAIAKEKSPPPPPKSGKKRLREETSNETDSKRAKKDEEKKTGEDPKKPAAFQRLWTEDDEISILQGMIDFKHDTGKSPYNDINVCFDYIKNSISFEVSKNQFMDKLRSLKKKYLIKEEHCFTKPHDHECYKLCNFIWGPDGVAKKGDSVSFLNGGKTVEDGDAKIVLGDGGGSDWFERRHRVTMCSFLLYSIPCTDTVSVRSSLEFVREISVCFS